MCVRQWVLKGHENLAKDIWHIFKTIVIIALAAKKLRHLHCFIVLLVIILTFLRLGTLHFLAIRAVWIFQKECCLDPLPVTLNQEKSVIYMYKQSTVTLFRTIKSLALTFYILYSQLHHTKMKLCSSKSCVHWKSVLTWFT